MPPPPKLDYASNIYLHITSSTAPPSQHLHLPLPAASPAPSSGGASASANTAFDLEYVGPVGELQGEHIYAIRPAAASPAAATVSASPTATASSPGGAAATAGPGSSAPLSLSQLKSDGALLAALTLQVKKLDGVQAARVLQEQQRAKR
jgi:hypothetical protein